MQNLILGIIYLRLTGKKVEIQNLKSLAAAKGR
jgi:hypothetical protein